VYQGNNGFSITFYRRRIYLCLSVDNIVLSSSESANKRDIERENDNRSTFPQHIEQSIQILSNIQRIKHLYLSLLRNARKEVLLVFPTTNAVRREEGVGIIAELRQASQRGVTVRLLTPMDDFVSPQLEELRTAGIVVRQIESPAETKFKLLIVDRKFSLVIETKDDSRGSFERAIGLATFSNSKATVLPYVTIFESFWRETDLYEKAREADRIKDEFVNIAAHELRNPISPILGSADFALEDIRKLKEGKGDDVTLDSLDENIHIIARNAAKLYKLSEDILQVSRIESGTFSLRLDKVDLKALCQMAVQDTKRRIEAEKKPIDIRLDYEIGGYESGQGVAISCDSSKISQVLHNLLDNAVRFTNKGTITISIAMHDESSVIFKIEDSGIGIDREIKNRLFDKFASKSNGGTGLGLYLSKKIIEAHGGKIWGSNNPSGIGATFSFTVPTDLRATANGEYTSLANPDRGFDAQTRY
jgi:two-component system sensor histidine kinase VicK